jgi:hypothetical protein
VEVADVRALQEQLAAGGGASLRRSAPVKAAAELKQDVLDHEIVLTAALNQVGGSTVEGMPCKRVLKHVLGYLTATV